MQTYLECELPEELCKHLFLSFIKRPSHTKPANQQSTAPATVKSHLPITPILGKDHTTIKNVAATASNTVCAPVVHQQSTDIIALSHNTDTGTLEQQVPPTLDPNPPSATSPGGIVVVQPPKDNNNKHGLAEKLHGLSDKIHQLGGGSSSGHVNKLDSGSSGGDSSRRSRTGRCWTFIIV